jgi:hypothetical protein
MRIPVSMVRAIQSTNPKAKCMLTNVPGILFFKIS